MTDAFRKAVGYIYSWVKSRYEDVFTDLPESAETYVNAEPGYSVNLSYDAENVYFSEKTTHLDTKIPTRVWISEAVICREGDRLKFTVSNRYAEPADRYRDNENVLFSDFKTGILKQNEISVCHCQVAYFNLYVITAHMPITSKIKVSTPVTTIIHTIAETTARVVATPTLSALRPL